MSDSCTYSYNYLQMYSNCLISIDMKCSICAVKSFNVKSYTCTCVRVCMCCLLLFLCENAFFRSFKPVLILQFLCDHVSMQALSTVEGLFANKHSACVHLLAYSSFVLSGMYCVVAHITFSTKFKTEPCIFSNSFVSLVQSNPCRSFCYILFLLHEFGQRCFL